MGREAPPGAGEDRKYVSHDYKYVGMSMWLCDLSVWLSVVVRV